MTIAFGSDPVRAEVQALLTLIDKGQVVDGSSERKHVDLKEEAGRRDKQGNVTIGSTRNETAAEKLAGEATCMANTPGGGALIVGVADDGTVIGTQLDAEWLRQRIYELTQRMLTVDVTEAVVAGTRLLVLVSPTAVEPIRHRGRIHWRVGDRCVEVDATTWHARRMQTLHYDWSADDSGAPASEVRQQAIAVARDFLRASGDAQTEELSDAPDHQLLRRLNAVTGRGTLTNAGRLAFIGRGEPSLDYIHRERAGADSTARVRRSGRSLLEELDEVFRTVETRNSTRHIETGLVVRQIKDIPPLAAREAIVNGVAHRDWNVPTPTVVEHIGHTLRVTSPGGFYGGVNATNIITHPSQSRNGSLAQLLADLRVAEREGIGVDRMVREMVRIGYPAPGINEIDGPFVRASLVGDAVDLPWIAWLASMEPPREAQDVSSLLLLQRLLTEGWIDEASAAPLIQLPVEEARGAVLKLSHAAIGKTPLLHTVEGTPEGTATAWRLSTEALAELTDRDREMGHPRPLPSRRRVASSYAQGRGRISSTELGSLVGASPSNVGATLKQLAQEGVLDPSSAAGRGRGFYYRWHDAPR
ncbi:RNA-binding domain-containing protein [Demequina salsinemoris]|uniref:RNA-binding domain-containing protein n=1 Tax=Demequina salsinemoris TaxID=577470 RepID=UPI000786059D|nr:ATP-binding protein [Demequina salsinemoris]